MEAGRIREEGWVKGGDEVRGGGSEDRGRWLEAGRITGEGWRKE